MEKRQKSDVVVSLLSDIHYAGPTESQRRGHESKAIKNPILRALVDFYRHYIWLRDVLAHNHLLDYFLEHAKSSDFVIAVGDYSCDTRFVGCSDAGSMESTEHCLRQLRERFPGRFQAVLGDHELGKKSVVGGVGGMRLASWECAVSEMRMKPIWVQRIGAYHLIGITSSLVGLPVFSGDVESDELERWRALRADHLKAVAEAFMAVEKGQRVLLFCHDPSALPFLLEMDEVVKKVQQIEHTFIGHLHSPLILRLSRVLCGMPQINFLGTTVKRLSAALRVSRQWAPFKVVLCPSLAGIELLKDGAFLQLKLDPEARRALRIDRHAVPRGGLQSR